MQRVRARLGKRKGDGAKGSFTIYRGAVVPPRFFRLHIIHRVHRVVDTSFASFVGRPPRNLSIRSTDRADKRRAR